MVVFTIIVLKSVPQLFKHKHFIFPMTLSSGLGRVGLKDAYLRPTEAEEVGYSLGAQGNNTLSSRAPWTAAHGPCDH